MNRNIRSPRGNKISCKSWQQEAAMRMLMNNLDRDVAEKPDELIVYGGVGKAARNWACYDSIIKSLLSLENDETLLIQSGKPVGVFKTHEYSPRVIISNSMLVPAWANWEYFRTLEAMGLIMYGQMTAGSWIYIGTQGILQGTYETFSALAQKHYKDDLSGKIVLTAGLGGMGGAQPLAVTMNGGVAICVDVDENRINRRINSAYCDMMVTSIDEALRLAESARKDRRPKSIALLGNAAEIFPALLKRGFLPDVVTDQTSAHDELNGYVPHGIEYQKAIDLRKSNPEKYIQMAYHSMNIHCDAMIQMQKKGAVVFDYGNNLRGQAFKGGLQNAFDYPGFVPAYIRPLFCEGKGPFRWAALSGNPEDIYRTDRKILDLFPENIPLKRWLTLARERVTFQGLPARICWLGYGERDRAGLAFNEMVANGELEAPIVIGRDHLDCGSVASPNRETEKMKDGSDAIADWPILNALLNTASGASWVSVHHGGGVGIGYSLHAGMVAVADGTKEMANRLERVLTNDPGTGIMRHADAGYSEAIDSAKKHRMKIPMMQQ